MKVCATKFPVDSDDVRKNPPVICDVLKNVVKIDDADSVLRDKFPVLSVLA